MSKVCKKCDKGLDDILNHVKDDVKKVKKLKKAIFRVISKLLLEVADEKKDSVKEGIVANLIIAAAASEGVTLTPEQAGKIAEVVVNMVDEIMTIMAKELEKQS